MFSPIQANSPKHSGDELLKRMRFASGDNVIVGIVLLAPWTTTEPEL